MQVVLLPAKSMRAFRASSGVPTSLYYFMRNPERKYAKDTSSPSTIKLLC